MLHRVAIVRTDVSEEPNASFIGVTRIGELGTTQAATRKEDSIVQIFKIILAILRKLPVLL
jgi:hypothetical protein